MLLFDNTERITNWNVYQPYFEIDMYYSKDLSNRHKARRKEEIAVVLAARFGFVSAITLTAIFEIQRHKVTELLNKLTKKQLLAKVKTSRAADGVVYVLTFSGARYAEEVIRHEILFRSKTNPIEQLNQNSIMHDSILQFVLMQGVHNKTTSGQPAPLWRGFVTEKEFKRLYPSNDIKNVDAVVINSDYSTAAIELENSFKNKNKVEATLLKLANNMLCQRPLFDKVFFVSSSGRVIDDTRRFQRQLLDELPHRYDKKSKAPYLTTQEATLLQEKLIFRTKFTELINALFYT
ncbi:hypothetical protein [Pseudoalteromonas sp. BDTF-M6]|uniref:hypothetical protein n=1 Tax=Pseudoalteromonas sp. BDTF-M6 TaxID=2796132 RepID=UPI001BAEA333|nr:hypothetical protein [Pseudoalteromonas sp. BDTF-M6]MBS3796370.1 hypothetical protein [Pseudoalteromonas sp. BDTF-M6]